MEFDIRVAFEILDVSPIMGDTQRSKDYYEVPLSVASNKLIQKIANGQFVVTLHGRAFAQVQLLYLITSGLEREHYIYNSCS